MYKCSNDIKLLNHPLLCCIFLLGVLGVQHTFSTVYKDFYIQLKVNVGFGGGSGPWRWPPTPQTGGQGVVFTGKVQAFCWCPEVYMCILPIKCIITSKIIEINITEYLLIKSKFLKRYIIFSRKKHWFKTFMSLNSYGNKSLSYQF